MTYINEMVRNGVFNGPSLQAMMTITSSLRWCFFLERGEIRTTTFFFFFLSDVFFCGRT